MERFWTKVNKQADPGCWEWTACKINGYGRFAIDDTNKLAHRVSWWLVNGEWPPSHLMLCHRCNNPGCVNPSHLYVGTASDNSKDCKTAGNLGKAKGGSVNTAKMDEEQVLYARHHGMSPTEVSKVFGVTRATASKALRGNTWKHLSGDRTSHIKTAASGHRRIYKQQGKFIVRVQGHKSKYFASLDEAVQYRDALENADLRVPLVERLVA